MINDVIKGLIQSIEAVYKIQKLSYLDKNRCNQHFDNIIDELGRLSNLAESVKKEET